MTGGEEDIIVGHVAGVHGIHGEIKVKPADAAAGNLRAAEEIRVGPDGAEGERFRVESVKSAGRLMVLKLNGVDDRDRAESLKGNVLKLQRNLCKTLPGGSYYVFDLVGLKVVTVAGETVGEVRDVLMLPAQPVLVVIDGEKEVLIPAVKTFVQKVDLQSRTLVVEPIEGMLDGNDH